MKTSTPPPPALSAILITPGRLDRLRGTIAALQAQTISDQIELVLVATEHPSPPLDEKGMAWFHSYQSTLLPKSEFTSATAWALGAQVAQAPIVVLCEDHSFPDPTWAERLLGAHRQPWAVVGPAVRNANPNRLMAWADFFLAYSDWAYPATSGSRDHLPGHNSSYKRDLLLTYGAELARKFEAETLLHWEMRRQGHQLYLQADAVTNHVNFTRFGYMMRLTWLAGWHFGAARTSSWSWRRRLPWILASILIPAVRLHRIYREIRRPGRFDGSLPGLMAILCLLLLCDGIGQMAGAAFGPRNLYPIVSHLELELEERFKGRTI